ncbi:rhomboid family intramembrane serine protease [Alkalihalophilus pseudofirmus]|uniref:Rhomboid family intramembrane serine protease n=1 Tax=Alkalihalophilus pseudofirmus TaxID=79885 RepID=A0AAJ2KT87_ALKPS|nr:rhomboid family intramembrane serine protease [Alkalihalophilus pseudofirmus]MDV2884637.1 rhomboid family intramembrane serine protease [Alkalihalophilus pseudofirmus]
MEWNVLKKSPVTIAFFSICAVIFLYGKVTTSENIRFLALSYEQFPQNWFTLLSHGFVHVEWYHFLINMFLLLYIGSWVEQLLGKIKFLVLVVVCILSGGLTLVLLSTAGIGFSVAGMAILFYYHLTFPWEKELFFNLPNFVLPLAIVVISIVALTFGVMSSVGHIPHLVGAMIGIVFLIFFRKQHYPI